MNDLIGRYEIIDEIGRGGMGTVYRALDPQIHREVALKLLASHYAADPSYVQRFQREVRLIGRLEHPHIIPVYDTGEHQGRPYIVMRLLTGGTLKSHIGRTGFGMPQMLDTLDQIADGLDAAHQRNIVHRDLKPSNILFDNKGVAFLSDFGIAKDLDADSQITGTAFMVGTPAYMSPEQFSGDAVDGRSDQYSLAIMVFEALAGRLPFEGKTTASVMFQHLTQPVPDIHAIDNHVPVTVGNVLRKALAKKPADRFEQVTDFTQALRAAAEASDTAIVLTPPPAEETIVDTPGQVSAAAAVAAAAASATPVDPTTLERQYRLGVTALSQGQWQTAAEAFQQVTVIDSNYRDALALQRQAEQQLTRLAQRPDAGEATQLDAKPAPPAAAPAKTRSKTPLVVAGIGALLLIGLLLICGLGYAGYRWFQNRPVAAGPTEEAVAVPVVEMAEEATAVLEVAAWPVGVRQAGGGASIQAAGTGAATPIEAGAAVTVGPGAIIQAGNGTTVLVLPDQTELYLGTGSELEIGRLAAAGADEPTTLALEGRMLVVFQDGSNNRLLLSRPAGVLVSVNGPQLGLVTGQSRPGLTVACLADSCALSLDGQGLRLRSEEAALVADNRMGGPDPVPWSLLCDLTDIALCPEEPTATATTTHVATKTVTPTATDTRVPPTATRRPATATPAPPTATQPPPTQPPPTQPPPTQPPPPTNPPPPTDPPPPPTYTPEPP